MAVYKGPTSDFPYGAYRILGVSHIALGLCSMVLGLVHVTLTYEDRNIFLMSGSVTIWCPLFAVAAGVVALVLCRRRYWEVECTVKAFVVVSMLAALTAMVTIFVTIFLEFYYYDIINLEPVETFISYKRRLDDGSQEDGYLALLCLIVIFAGCEFLIANVGVLVGCCCSPVYEPDRVEEIKVIQKPQTVMMTGQQPMQVMQNGQYMQQPQMLQQGPVVYVPSTIGTVY